MCFTKLAHDSERARILLYTDPYMPPVRSLLYTFGWKCLSVRIGDAKRRLVAVPAYGHAERLPACLEAHLFVLLNAQSKHFAHIQDLCSNALTNWAQPSNNENDK